jgi:hypothetical protein
MTALTEFFLHSSPTIIQLDLLEITHPNFTQTYRLVRNAVRGCTVLHEGAVGPFTYTYLPMKVKPVGNANDLTQALEVSLGDLGSIIQTEIAALTLANRMNIKPTLNFRNYRSDDLTAPIFGPMVLQIEKITCTDEGNTFQAIAPNVNNSRTGELYTIDVFPMLRGFF